MFLATSYAIAVLFSAMARNIHQAVYLAVFSVLPSTVISGFLVPTSTMPRAIELAALGLPATHYVTIVRAVVVRGARVGDVTPLAAMGLILSSFSTFSSCATRGVSTADCTTRRSSSAVARRNAAKQPL